MQRIMIFMALFCLPLFVYGSDDHHGHGADHNTSGKADMSMHHLHIMMNHGLAMAADGANMVMLARMGMSPEIDTTTLDHGRQMIKEGKAVIQHAVSDKVMKGSHKQGQGDAPLMSYTYELGDAMVAVINDLERMTDAPKKSGDAMTMHHMHMMVDHVLQMAVEGANLNMLGEMGMAAKVDSFSINHGKKMLDNARALWKEMVEGEAMRVLHQREAGGSTEMKETHSHADDVKKVMALLDKTAVKR